MEFDYEYTFTGVFIGIIACIISGTLIYLFKHFALLPHSSINSIKQQTGPKNKKGDVKKFKKIKKAKLATSTFHSEEREIDKNGYSDIENLVDNDIAIENALNDLVKNENECEFDLVKSTALVNHNDNSIIVCDNDVKIEQNDYPLKQTGSDASSGSEKVVVSELLSPGFIDVKNNYVDETKFEVFESNKSKKSKRRTFKKNAKDKVVFKLSEALDNCSYPEVQSLVNLRDSLIFENKASAVGVDGKHITKDKVFCNDEILKELEVSYF